MAPQLSDAVGYELPPIPVSWKKRDILLYAVGVGAKKDDLSLVYELHKDWAPLPTYAATLFLKGADDDVTHFASKNSSEPVPGLPKMNPLKMVHATMSTQILKDLPSGSGPGWNMSRRIVGINENPRGIVVLIEYILRDPKGTPYAKLHASTFNLGAKATGNKFSKFIAGPPQAKPIPKDRKPDHTIKDQTSPEQAILYRLSGDFNPLHIDPAPGKAAGFGGVILHGLSTYGFTARALIATLGNNDAKSLKMIGAKFSAPVKPGDALETQVWEVGPGPDGTLELSFITRDLNTGTVVLADGIAYIKKTSKSKL